VGVGVYPLMSIDDCPWDVPKGMQRLQLLIQASINCGAIQLASHRCLGNSRDSLWS